MNFTYPNYWLTRPPFKADPSLRSAFEAVLQQAAARGPALPMEYPLDAPKWQFLCYAVEEAGLVLHGSPDPDIRIFEPRQPKDLREFGAQNAVYAANDGIWPMYFAILNRRRFPSAIVSACIHLEHADGQVGEPHYFFSISRQIFDKNPWSTGWVYLLPGVTFTQEPPMRMDNVTGVIHQLASLSPVVPLARLEVEPGDFPFLLAMRSHDDDRLAEYAQALQQGLPWPD